MRQRLRRRAWIALSLTALLFATPSVRAEDHDSDAEPEEAWVAKWSNGFKIEKGDEFKLKFGGRIQADFAAIDPDPELEDTFGPIDGGFDFRRARLFFEGTVYERVKFKAQYDFAGGDADFKDVWIGLILKPGELRLGHFKEHFSLGELTSSKYIAFVERAPATEAFSPSRNSGVGFSAHPSERLNYGIGAYYEADDFGESIDPDRINVTGRLVYRPIWEDDGRRLLHLGLSATSKSLETGGELRFRGRPGASFGPRLVDTGGIPADDALGAALELGGVEGPFWYQAEYYNYDVSSPSGMDVALRDPGLDGYYVQVGYYLTGEHRRYKTSAGAFDRQRPNANWGPGGGKGAWEVLARYSDIDLSEAFAGAELETVTLGVNWYLNPVTRFMLNLVHAETAERGDVDLVVARWQIDF